MADKKITELTGYTPPIDDDVLPIVDTTTGVTKKITFTSIKAFLKTYFDTLYNNYVHPNHTGDVTSVADGATTIANAAVSLAKMANLAANTIIGRITASTGVPEALTAANVRTIINVADGATANSKATATENVTGTDDAKFLTPLANVPAFYDFMGRQALLNSNFNVKQRLAASLAVTIDAGQQFLIDRWTDYGNDDGGTAPTLTRTRETLTAGELPNAVYYTRLTTNGAGTSLGDASRYRFAQNIEYGTKYLCGDGKKLTLSFYARSSIAGKKICPVFIQNYGTGGSPTSNEHIVGATITLTSSWVKYTQTFTSNTLTGKTFGTDDNDYIQMAFVSQWGDTNIYGIDGVETFGGSGTLDYAQIQLCAGDVALPFMPKSYGEELRDCQRYFQIFTSAEDIYTTFASGFCSSTTSAVVMRPLFQKMRIDPTLAFSTVNADFLVYDGGASTATTNVQDDRSTSDTIKLLLTTASGLTDGSGCTLISNNKTTAYISVSAEL